MPRIYEETAKVASDAVADAVLEAASPIALVSPQVPQPRELACATGEQDLDAVTVVDADRADAHRQDQAERVDHEVALDAVHLLAAVVPVPAAPLGAFDAGLSTIPALGVGSRPRFKEFPLHIGQIRRIRSTPTGHRPPPPKERLPSRLP
ncbi:hypothetical protein GCM10010324_63760 [Streptomyces hiroshimensis]|uniref:Uncharacterized protein n=1 Tax=Streptomyces hiroshimensis TaxID=66424 RepID=A0ABQ2ZC80_9ACTN|nr:hypothetical protein GCM10010324_63760 [Streptomyces hiroshimensis]